MDQLTPYLKVTADHEHHDRKKAEYKLLGRDRVRRGLTLFAYDRENETVYKVPVIKQESSIALDKTIINGDQKATVNPKHPILWALNMKNAIRKFKKLK